MAFAFNAVADDATAISWNPAGITQLKKPEFSLIQRVQLEKVSYEDLKDDTYSNTQEGKPYFTFDYFSFIYPINIHDRELVLGVAYQNQINYKFSQTFSYPNANHEASAKGILTVNSVSLCAGYTLTDFFSLGVSFNKYFSLGNRSEWNYLYRNPDNIHYADITEVYSFSGINFILGAFIDLSSYNVPLKIAGRVNTPLKLTDDFARVSDHHYELSTDDIYRIQKVEGSETYHIPWILGTGISYRIGDYLTLAADFDLKPFKDAERTMQLDLYDDVLYDPPRDELMVDSTDLLVPSGDNLNQFRAGVEYILHPDFALIPVRIGWKNNPTNQANTDANGLPTSQVNASSINAGLGLISQRFSVDLAYEFYKSKQEGVNTFLWEHTQHSVILSIIVYIR